MTTSCDFRPLATLEISAASGLLCISDTLLVVADDEGALGRFERTGRRTTSIDLGLPRPPSDPRMRKREKPDFEALVEIGEGLVAVLGSGSTPMRHRGKLVDLGTANAQDIDLRPLHAHLAREIAELNLEGAAFHKDACVLAQRGNGTSRTSAIVLLDASGTRSAMKAGVLSAEVFRALVRVDLGDLDGVPLGFTDLAVDPRGRLWFAAAAEDTKSTYDDGACAGSVVGYLDESYHVAWQTVATRHEKVEGLCFSHASDTEMHGYLVTDPDDPTKQASLLGVVGRG